MKKHIIWDSAPDFEDWEDDLRAEHPEADEDELYDIMYETNNNYLDDERLNLGGIKVPNGIFAVADLGFWFGRRMGVLPPGKIPTSVAGCLKSYTDGDSELTIYVDEEGELRIQEAHHDGTNYYLFRAYRPEVTEGQKESLQELVLSGEAYDSRMRRLTYRLGDLIGDVFGWKFPHRPKCSQKGA